MPDIELGTGNPVVPQGAVFKVLLVYWGDRQTGGDARVSESARVTERISLRKLKSGKKLTPF